MEASVTATPSAYAVKNQDGDLLMPDEGSNNVYTVSQGTILTFEVSAMIEADSEYDGLVSEWYNNTVSGNQGVIAVLLWWWWINNSRNPDSPENTPELPNTPNAPNNTSKKGLFVCREVFNHATPVNSPVKISANLYPNVSPVEPRPFALVDFFVNVEAPPDVNPPELISTPADAEITVGIADRIPLSLKAIDPEDNLQAIEWYVEGYELPLRAHGVRTLDLFLHSANEDNFAYRFKEAGEFEITAAAYDNFSNADTFVWNVIVEEPVLTRSLPHAAEISVKAVDTKTFRVLANTEESNIDGVCWQNDAGTTLYMPIGLAKQQGDFLAFEWDTSFDFGIVNDFFETVKVTATGYTEDLSGEKVMAGNIVTWLVRTDRYVDESADLTFCGLDWKVKQSNPLTEQTAPGGNYFYSDNVSVDAEGLHLKMVQREGIWTCAEVFTENSMPRGIYRFYLEGGSGTRLDQLDAEIIFAPFFYSDGTREIDIEFSNWSANTPYGLGQFQYVVQPFGDTSLRRFQLNLDNSEDTSGKMTCEINWQDDSITFKSWLGHSASPPNEEAMLSEIWTYTDSFVPEPGDELRLHLNLYLKNNNNPDLDNAPVNGLPAHVIIRAIDHPANWKGWQIENFGEQNTLSGSSISAEMADPDSDNRPNLLEYALGGSPWQSDHDRQPKINLYQDPGSLEKYLDYTFTRRKASPHPLSETSNGIHLTPFLNYYIRSKPDLADTINSWLDEPVNQVGNPIDHLNGTETVTFRTEKITDDAPRKFLQLQVEKRNLEQSDN